MLTEKDTLLLNNALGSIEDAIAGIKGIKAAMGMTEQSHMERDLLAAMRRIQTVMDGEN